MELSKRIDLAFRTLVYLAVLDEGKRVTINDIAQSYDVPKSHLMKVVNALVNSGFINAVRGKNGGICLALDPQEINLKSIMQTLEPSLLKINCSTRNCIIDGHCGLPRILGKAQKAYMDELSGYNLSDIIAPATRSVLMGRGE